MEILEQAPLVLANGFGINTDIFETNIVNQIILGGGLFVLGRDFLTESLGQRQAEIMSGVQDSEKRLNEATTRLEEAKKQLSQARVIIEEIQKETAATKSKLLVSDYEAAKTELSRRFETAATTLTNRERLILSEIKQNVSLLALKQVVSTIEKQTGAEDEQSRYMQESIKMVGSSSGGANE
jgi:F-type H+-transporting ATPase subunit b